MPEALRRFRMMLAISVRADPVRSVAAVLTATGQHATLPVRAYGLKLVADGILRHQSHRAVTGVVLMVLLTAGNRLMAWWSLNVRIRLRENTQLYLDSYLMGLVAGVPGVAHHELPEYLDRMELIRAERGYLANPFNPISWTIASVIATISVIWLLGSVRPVLALLPLVGVPAAVESGRADEKLERLIDAQAEDNRVLRHLMELAVEAPAAKEIRIFGLGPEVLGRHRSLFGRLEAARIRLAVRASVGVVAAWAIFGAAYAASLVWVVHLAAIGATTPGSVALVLSLGGQLNTQLAETGWNVAWLIRTYRAVGRLVWLADYGDRSRLALRPERPSPVPERIEDGIAFEGVAFAYPGTDRAVLADINLVLPAGSTVAIVGENGAGKTTLVKLLSRLYEPSVGTIKIDGVPLGCFEVDEWRAAMSAGFQDFARFELIARQSVGVGLTTLMDSAPAVTEALQRGAAIEVVRALPEGLETQLGREFDGVELSLGQWQKLALGRAMMRPAPLVLVLDEPTASLDAPTEHDLFERFAGAARSVAGSVGGITILVSHRFSTVRMADLIVVVSGGRVAEVGGHDRLMALDGLYASLYRTQAQGYR
ncbi:MAG TPA: ABC transporter ATP-binding protein [Acidimicrobiales bacterium]|nr:ABC transporter ATP-binding protein [Acidimicrobiales bacterium]